MPALLVVSRTTQRIRGRLAAYGGLVCPGQGFDGKRCHARDIVDHDRSEPNSLSLDTLLTSL